MYVQEEQPQDVFSGIYKHSGESSITPCSPSTLTETRTHTPPSLLSSLQVHFEQAKHRVIARCPTSPGLVIWQLF